MGCRKLTYYETSSPLKVVSNDLIINENSYMGGYRYGFNGMERDDNVKGAGNSYNYKKRMYDSRVSRFLSIDPLTEKFPYYSPYQFAGNKPIIAIDLDGAEELVMTARTFIPQKFVDNPWFSSNFTSQSFKGDNRYEYNSEDASYRTEQKVVLDFDNMKIETLNNEASPTHGLDKNGDVIRSQISKAVKAGTIKAVPVTTMKSNMHYTVVHVKVNAANRLVSGSPEINYDLTIFIQPSDDKKSFNYKIKGAVDGFPAYELWITDKETKKSYLLFNRTPTKTGEDVKSLMPGMEHQYDYKGDSKDLKPSKKKSFKDTPNTPECDDC